MDSPKVKVVGRLTNGDHLWHCIYAFRRALLRRTIIMALVFLSLLYVFRDGDFSVIADPYWCFVMVLALVALVVFTFIIDLVFYFVSLKIKQLKNKEFFEQKTLMAFMEDSVFIENALANGTTRYEAFGDILLYNRHAVLKAGNLSYVVPYRDIAEGTKEQLVTLLSEIKEKKTKK